MAGPPKRGIGIMIGLRRAGDGPPPLRGPGEPDQDDAPDAGATGGAMDDKGVKPEWVDYGTEAENCKNCEYLAGDQCSVLNMPVGLEDHCKAFSPRQGAEDQGQPAGASPQGAPT